jgi:hypothetical protein
MKRSALYLLVSLLFASVSLAQQNAADTPASKEDVERYMETLHQRELVSSMMVTMKQQMHQIAAEQVKKQPSLPSDFVARMDRMFDDMLKNFPVDEILQAEVSVYQKHFTRGDIDALIAFYSTPTGQKFLRELPAITSEAMQAASPVIQRMMTKAMERVQDEVAQAQKTSDTDSPKKPQQN